MIQKNDNLHRNGSGYYDPTAYKALKNIEREGKTMDINIGEIWEMEATSGTRMAIVIAVHRNYSSVLLLNDEFTKERTIQINAQGLKCIDPGMVTYKFHRSFIKFIRKANDEEFADIMKQVSEALGLETEVPFGIVEDKALRAELVELKENNELKIAELLRSRDYYKNLFESMEKQETETIKLKTERDLYKSLYEQTFERLIAKAVLL